MYIRLQLKFTFNFGNVRLSENVLGKYVAAMSILLSVEKKQFLISKTNI